MFLISKDQFASRRKENQCCGSFLQTIACLSLFPGLFLIIIFFSAEKSICFFFRPKFLAISPHTHKKKCVLPNKIICLVCVYPYVFTFCGNTHTLQLCFSLLLSPLFLVRYSLSLSDNDLCYYSFYQNSPHTKQPSACTFSFLLYFVIIKVI